LARSKKAEVLTESNAWLPSGVITMIAESLPEIAFNESFRQRLVEMLGEKMSKDKIVSIAQAIVTKLPTMVESVLKEMAI
jgi:hypothetical protein